VHLKDIMKSHEYGDICLDGVNQVKCIYGKYSIVPPDIDYPDVLSVYYGRKFWKSTLNTIYNNRDKWNIFIKPVEDKLFTGKVIKKASDFRGMDSEFGDVDILCSDIVDIKAEWRCFIRYDKILDIRLYCGDWRYSYNPRIIEEAVKEFIYWKDRPFGCSIDFGVTSSGETIIVEVNDGYSLASYGLQTLDYARLISARNSQLYNVKDDLVSVCDVL